jgi:hypothetical protein
MPDTNNVVILCGRVSPKPPGAEAPGFICGANSQFAEAPRIVLLTELLCIRQTPVVQY